MTTVLPAPVSESRHRKEPAAHAPPRWVRPAAFGLLAATAVLYFWNLTASGYGNSFYAAAVQSGTQSWKAWLFGSLDSGNVLTVDKPPAALWVGTAFARIFGFSSFTVLAPQALMGVASVGILYLTVKRTSGPVAGLLAGAMLAVTPVAALMFRFNNPDALLVLLMVAGAYFVVRAAEKASPRWLALAGVAIGFGFLAKMMQAFLVLPAFGLLYLLAAPTSLGKRLLHLGGAVVALVVSAGWFIALVDLWPTASRPYIGGSEGDSLLELALGYNGLGRIFGGEGNGGMGGGGMGGNTGFGGSTGLFRMFGASFGTEISWLLPAALIGLVAGLWFTRRAPRTDKTRAALVLWGGWLVVTALVFSFMSGTVHPYYAVALAPAIAALVAISGRALWQGRAHLAPRATLAGMVVATAVWSFILLDRTPEWFPALRWIVAVLGVLVGTVLVMGIPATRRAVALVATAVVLTIGVSSAAYGVETASVAHTGSIPTSGPTSSAMGGFDDSSSAVGSLLAKTTTKWAAATTGSQSAASLELASGKAVIGIGGWSGSDPAPTLAEFKAYVAAGEVKYYIEGGRGGGPGGGSSEITDWVTANFTATTVDGQTVYDLQS
ncbi:glycosyl transferase [Amycolatopsis mediterranei S699]|uniref:Glycosyl transferase family protein n=2 Tax=Amycolatopsis mediterranei TaxID=33910 RepID=A0A0H3DEH4_AMYMU|nr:glycosyltransferase family 39 protein [Amycolatopsis mediterranei]ADJ48483.1 glycosyl transferase family protein [Amycolatopsis mediterranei U32]AEK45407.1 glycosyl transferase [Amycolatopsis mediterranei S699]AFO80194.1 glycosyl transferase [Amycolatopsis mediterranei S699]AGT87322.1 glycosyl transferase [Amycolatopsis mediterranei RB]KDO11000.1 glycosyl transferase [Amycolatopsis mediterranei]